DVGQRLHDAGGPFDANGLRVGRVTQTEMRDQAVLAVAMPTGNFPHLPGQRTEAILCLHPDLRSDRSAVGGAAYAFDLKPLIRVAVVVIKEIGLSIDVPDKEVEESV